MKENNDKDWDNIDKLADQNNGHYDVPRVPNDKDTSEVSEYIRKHKTRCVKEEISITRNKSRVGIPNVPLDPRTRKILEENQRIITKKKF